MNKFIVEYYIANKYNETIKLEKLENSALTSWRINIEARALSEFYKKKISLINNVSKD